MEMAHVFRDGRSEAKSFKGAGRAGVRKTLDREYGLGLLESGAVVMLCPNCHWKYDHGGSTIRPEDVSSGVGTIEEGAKKLGALLGGRWRVPVQHVQQKSREPFQHVQQKSQVCWKVAVRPDLRCGDRGPCAWQRALPRSTCRLTGRTCQ